MFCNRTDYTSGKKYLPIKKHIVIIFVSVILLLTNGKFPYELKFCDRRHNYSIEKRE